MMQPHVALTFCDMSFTSNVLVQTSFRGTVPESDPTGLDLTDLDPLCLSPTAGPCRVFHMADRGVSFVAVTAMVSTDASTWSTARLLTAHINPRLLPLIATSLTCRCALRLASLALIPELK